MPSPRKTKSTPTQSFGANVRPESPLPGRPYPLGAQVEAQGTNFALSSEIADAVELCLFDVDGAETRVELPSRTAHIWHGLVPGIGTGQRYGFRVHGPWAPEEGLRCNPAKLLLDPHATAIEGEVTWDESVFGHQLRLPGRPQRCRLSAEHAPLRCHFQ